MSARRLLWLSLLVPVLAQAHPDPGAPAVTFAYPPAPRGDVTDDYHGTKVADPYRGLEDADAPQTRAWIEAENKITFDFLDHVPERGAIKARLTELWNFERYSVPRREGGRYFFLKNDGLQNQSVLYVAESLDAAPRVLLDPNTLSTDGTVALSRHVPSHDGKRLAYCLASAGSDWCEWRVRDVDSGKDLGDHLRWIKFSSVSWTRDNQGFYYSRFPEPKAGQALAEANYHNKLYYHRLGAEQSADEPIYERPDHKEWEFSGEVTEDGRYLVITVSKGTDPKYLVLYRDLTLRAGPVVELIDRFEAEYSFVGNDGPLFYFKTNLAAPRGRGLAIDVRSPARERWRELIPQSTETLHELSLVGDRFVANYLKDAHSEVRIFDLFGQPAGAVKLPGIGSATGFDGRRDRHETFYDFTSFHQPATIYRLDAETGQTRVYRQPKVRFDPDRFETRQVFYPSRDGTKIPMFITHRKGLVLDGKNPTYLYGYGGFNISLSPWLSVAGVVWMELGGVFAVPNLRGGGEYGEEWHQAGTKLRKQTVFDDFIAAAKWLVANRYTEKSRLAIGGGSNGGLLVGACVNQRPDLFGAALPAVGVMDMLRFHKFTIGWSWVDDYGSSENPDEFRALLAYSPLHNLKAGTHYPAVLITTADHDDRVVPGHSFKYAAALQAAQAGPAPTLIRIETRAGHGAGKPTTKRIEESADQWAFLVRIFGLPVPARWASPKQP